jgi:hypothetical protein
MRDEVTLLGRELRDEAAAGFSRLKRTPCTEAVKLLDYLDTLGTTEREELFDGRARAERSAVLRRWSATATSWKYAEFLPATRRSSANESTVSG